MKKSFWIKGENLEKKFSTIFHQEGIPLLISPLLVRSLGGGQVDMARFCKRNGDWLIELVELKIGDVVSFKQQRRLKQTAKYLSHIFKCLVCQKFSLKDKNSRIPLI